MLALRYFKSLLIWNSILMLKQHNTLFPNQLFNPGSIFERLRNLRSLLCLDPIKGYRLYRNNDDPNSFVLEFGEWDFDKYISDWIFFINLSLCDKDLSFMRLVNSIKDYNQKTNTDISAVIESLWDEMWIISATQCAFMKKNLLRDDSNEKDAYDSYEIITNLIESAKQSVKNLDQWFSRLHKIIPEVIFSEIKSLEEESDDSNSYFRFFEEMSADIGCVFLCMASIVVRGVRNELFSSHMNDISKGAKNEKDFFKHMSYLYSSRIAFPKYWYDDARIMLTNPENSLDRLLLLKSLQDIDEVLLIGYTSQISADDGGFTWVDLIMNKDVLTGKMDNAQFYVSENDVSIKCPNITK